MKTTQITDDLNSLIEILPLSVQEELSKSNSKVDHIKLKIAIIYIKAPNVI